jgi:hypothetical protein
MTIVKRGLSCRRTVARMSDMPAFDIHLVPNADAPTGMGEPGLPPLAPRLPMPSRGRPTSRCGRFLST